jgi:hypothetical protein
MVKALGEATFLLKRLRLRSQLAVKKMTADIQ